MTWVQNLFAKLLQLRRRWLGLIAGGVLWLLWMIVGFWATILLLLLLALGFAAGRIMEERKSWKDIVDKLLSERYTE